MLESAQFKKLLLMGLGASGKSSIRSIVFEGKSSDDVKDYKATINYQRSAKQIIDRSFLIFDCGGQKAFISDFIGKKAEFIFSKVSVLVWIVDTGDTDQVTRSQYYFINAITQLKKYSPNAVIFCLFHKMDLFPTDKAMEIIETMKPFFYMGKDIEIQYRSTTIFDESIYQVMGEILQTILLKSTKARTVSETIQEFIAQNKELSGIAVYTDEGLPVFEEGELTEKIILPTNLWLTDYSRIKDHFTTNTYKSSLETTDYIFIFQRMKEGEFVLSGIARKTAPLRYVQVKMDQIANIVDNLL
ncbi:MAG: ADP-ribosylation factor-like protein [Candidatus Hodarchaeales archaeon]|jgi:GTPase SAR1 family protein